MLGRLLVLTAFLVLLSGCAHVIPKEILQQVAMEIIFAALRKAPHAYQGELVLLGGGLVKDIHLWEKEQLRRYEPYYRPWYPLRYSGYPW